MNCECVYTIKGGNEKDFDAFAKELETFKYGELYPVSYAKVTKDVQSTKDYDGYGSCYILKANTYVIFVSVTVTGFRILRNTRKDSL